jgi:DNA polymerase III epsilon subunit-like protein
MKLYGSVPSGAPSIERRPILAESSKLRLKSGAEIPRITRKTADQKNYLTRNTLNMMHLMPVGDPVAYDEAPDGSIVYYFDPMRVTEAPPDLWYGDKSDKETMTLESGAVIERMSSRRAADNGFYTKDRLLQMNYEPFEEPVAYNVRGTGENAETVYFYDKRTAKKLPLYCVKCGKDIRYKRKLCRECYEADLAERRKEGDEHRGAYYGMDRSRVLFFDLELTGVYDHDEILSITIVDANGKLIMDTLVKPARTRKWKRTEKIHGITPDMVEDAPLLTELIPTIKEIFANMDHLVAYGVSTDYSHIKYIYDTEAEREALHDKVRCCANEFVRYAHEHRPDVEHASLIDAMEAFGIEWDGIPHSSIADTYACMRVWEKLFPNYYEDAPALSLR